MMIHTLMIIVLIKHIIQNNNQQANTAITKKHAPGGRSGEGRA